MSLWIDDLADYIDSNSAALTIGTNLFVGSLPDDPQSDSAVGLMAYDGTAPTTTFGAVIPKVERPRLQVMSRHNYDYAAALTLSYSIMSILTPIANQSIGTTTFHSVTALGSPMPMGPDSSLRLRFVNNYDIAMVYK